ncbi:MAG: hypothetical protein ACK559_27815, partial [bacterium]
MRAQGVGHPVGPRVQLVRSAAPVPFRGQPRQRENTPEVLVRPSSGRACDQIGGDPRMVKHVGQRHHFGAGYPYAARGHERAPFDQRKVAEAADREMTDARAHAMEHPGSFAIPTGAAEQFEEPAGLPRRAGRSQPNQRQLIIGSAFIAGLRPVAVLARRPVPVQQQVGHVFRNGHRLRVRREHAV